MDPSLQVDCKIPFLENFTNFCRSHFFAPFNRLFVNLRIYGFLFSNILELFNMLEINEEVIEGVVFKAHLPYVIFSS